MFYRYGIITHLEASCIQIFRLVSYLSQMIAGPVAI